MSKFPQQPEVVLVAKLILQISLKFKKHTPSAEEYSLSIKMQHARHAVIGK